jgi:GNAT superfamily N-acetyltransferase
MSIEVKVLRSDDADLLLNVALGVFDEPINVPATKSFLDDPRHHIAVALDDSAVVGFVSAVHYAHPDKPAPELWINEVGVADSHLRRGIASALLRAMFDHARKLGCVEAWVLTDRDNAPAMKLYGSVGGTASDQMMFSFDLSK